MQCQVGFVARRVVNSGRESCAAIRSLSVCTSSHCMQVDKHAYASLWEGTAGSSAISSSSSTSHPRFPCHALVFVHSAHSHYDCFLCPCIVLEHTVQVNYIYIYIYTNVYFSFQIVMAVELE